MNICDCDEPASTLAGLCVLCGYMVIAEEAQARPASNVNTGKAFKPMVTRDEYNAARAVLDALEPGYYVKCGGGCNGWYSGGSFTKVVGGPPICEKCRSK